MFRHQPTLLQLDAKLNLGMSGGAVVNLQGELVGITTTGGNPQGFDAQAGYAIPLDALGRRVVQDLLEGKEATYGCPCATYPIHRCLRQPRQLDTVANWPRRLGATNRTLLFRESVRVPCWAEGFV